jgi:hypothetical protein
LQASKRAGGAVRFLSKRVHAFLVLYRCTLRFCGRSIRDSELGVDRCLTGVPLGVGVLVRLVGVLGQPQAIPRSLQVLTCEFRRTRLLGLGDERFRRFDLRFGIWRRRAGPSAAAAMQIAMLLNVPVRSISGPSWLRMQASWQSLTAYSVGHDRAGP